MNAEIRFYWRLFLRRAPAMVALILLCTGVALAVAMRAPTTYRTEALLLVESAQIPGSLAESTVTTSSNESITLISQQLLTRANLLRLADDLDVFENYSRMTPDTIVERMRSNTSLNSSARRNEPTRISIAFEARTGAIAATVVNEYVTNIINANVELRTGRAENTLDFFEQEVARLNADLNLRSAQIAEFQSENADALPGEQSFRLTRMSLLQERINSWTRELGTLEDQRERLVAVFEATGQVSDEGGRPLTEDEQQLAALEADLDSALAVLSDTNPRVTLLQRQIDRLRTQIATAQTASDERETEPEQNPNRVILDLQLTEIDAQIEDLTAQIAEAEEEIVLLEDAISRTPANAITLSGLDRDYENVRGQYDRAVQRLAEASTGERIELSSRGQRITLIEPASIPEEPHSPNRALIVGTGGAVGGGLAVALFILLEILNRSVRRPAEITRTLGIQPLATIPYIESRSRRIARRFTQVAVFLLVIAGVPAALWAIDTYYLPLDQLAGRILDRLGLS